MNKKVDPFTEFQEETRCPQCLHVLNDGETVSYPSRFICPYCNIEGKCIYAEVYSFEQIARYEKEQGEDFLRLKSDLAKYITLRDGINKIVEEWDFSNRYIHEVYISAFEGMIESLTCYENWRKQDSARADATVP